jgi:hypothetical protein
MLRLPCLPLYMYVCLSGRRPLPEACEIYEYVYSYLLLKSLLHTVTGAYSENNALGPITDQNTRDGSGMLFIPDFAVLCPLNHRFSDKAAQ